MCLNAIGALVATGYIWRSVIIAELAILHDCMRHTNPVIGCRERLRVTYAAMQYVHKDMHFQYNTLEVCVRVSCPNH